MANSTGLQFTLQLAGAEDLDLAVTTFTHTERLSHPFKLTITFASRDGQLVAEDWLDRDVSLTIWQQGEPRRRIHGIVAEFHRRDRGHRRTYYDLVVRPALWRLGLSHDSRLFQDLDAQQIITTLCQEHGLTDITWALTRTLPVKEYTAQCQESDLAYLQRLAAAEGLMYFHEFDDDGHRLVFADAPWMLANLGERPYHARAGGVAAEPHVRHLIQRSRVRPASATLEDYYFQRPAYQQRHTHDEDEARLQGQHTHYDHYTYPGGFKRDEPGQAMTRFRLEHLRRNAQVATGKSDLAELRPGCRFHLVDHDVDAMNRNWQVIEVVHHGTQPQAVEEDAVGVTARDEAGMSDATEYHNDLTLIPGDRVWRPDPLPKPRVQGAQVATVVGPEGEEIYCDEHGRVKVRFHWDRADTPDERASAWVRVAQGWAGAGYGMLALPRIGHQVLVEHVLSDPDQPIIVGRLYHATNVPPYALPEHKTRTVIRTQTHKGQGSNELRFEDRREAEEIYLHAQRDHNTVIRNDETHRIGNNRRKSVEVDQSESIGQDKTSSVGRDHTENIGQDVRKEVSRDVYYTVGQSQKERYGKDVLQQVGNTLKQDIHADRQVTVGRHANERVQGEYVLEVTESITNNTRRHVLQASDTFEIRGPAGKIVLDASGITLEAPHVHVKGNLTSGGSGSASVRTLSGAVNDALPLCKECEKLASRS